MPELLGAAITLLCGIAGATSAAPEYRDCATCPTMVVVPAGQGSIGSPQAEIDRRATERSPATANLRHPFSLAKTEVTRAQYRRFVDATGHRPTIPERNGEPLHGCNAYDGAGYGYVYEHSWQQPGYLQSESHPVVCVSWSDAVAYAAWLSRETGRPYRLPSAVEFEYASRAGSSTPWYWGTESAQACEHANIADRTFLRRYPERPGFACTDGYIYTAPVGKFIANDFGLHDMVGNAWEWTADCWHEELARSPLDGSAWTEDGDGQCEYRVPKGGSWISGIGWSRAAVRSRDGEHYRSFMLGFRVASDSVGPSPIP